MNPEKSNIQNPGFTKAPPQSQPLVEGKDYYLEGGRFVFTTEFHLKRGYCCESGCRHCPYGHKK